MKDKDKKDLENYQFDTSKYIKMIQYNPRVIALEKEVDDLNEELSLSNITIEAHNDYIDILQNRANVAETMLAEFKDVLENYLIQDGMMKKKTTNTERSLELIKKYVKIYESK